MSSNISNLRVSYEDKQVYPDVRDGNGSIRMTRILIVEDDSDIQSMLRLALSSQSYSVEQATNGEDALQILVSSDFELIILDWEMPGLTGPEICKKYRNRGGEAPILFVTARGSIQDKELGFTLGADDYLTKPFHLQELLLRVNALLRRHKSIIESVIHFGDLELDQKNRQITRSGKVLKITPKEFDVLHFLMRHPTQVFSATQLLHLVWPSDSYASEQTVRTCIKRLRETIDVPNRPSYVHNQRAHGYMLNPASND